MKNSNSITKLLLASVAVSAMLFTGCTKHPDQDQLSQLEEARAAAQSAEQTLANKKQERMQLEQQVAQKESELSDKKAEKADVQQKMDERQ